MGKRTFGRSDAKPSFRESDFAGKPPQEQADLSESLNLLSQQLAATRKVLREIEDRTALYDGSLDNVTKARDSLGQSSDDDTAVSP